MRPPRAWARSDRRAPTETVRVRLHDLSSTAVRGIRDRHHDRHRVVFTYQAPRDDPAVDLLDDPPAPQSLAGRGLARLRSRPPVSPVGGAVARPLADAAHTLLILRAR